MKKEKFIIILIVIIIICIGGIIGTMFIINRNIEDDEIRKLQEGGAEYSKDELKNIELEITNLDSNVKNKIKYNSFIISMKEYMYKNGLISSNRAQCITLNQEGDVITIQFRLNDEKETIITSMININDYTYKFSDNY